MKKIILITFFIMLNFKMIAQDVIIKNDKTEIKAKITELTEDNIKYKKFEMLDGPVYNIKKSEVFMIMYKNGTKEYIENKPVEVKPEPTQTYINQNYSNNTNTTAQPTNINTNIDTSKNNVKEEVRSYLSISVTGSGAPDVIGDFKVRLDYEMYGAEIEYNHPLFLPKRKSKDMVHFLSVNLLNSSLSSSGQKVTGSGYYIENGTYYFFKDNKFDGFYTKWSWGYGNVNFDQKNISYFSLLDLGLGYRETFGKLFSDVQLGLINWGTTNSGDDLDVGEINRLDIKFGFKLGYRF